jgi:hypothetical protein
LGLGERFEAVQVEVKDGDATAAEADIAPPDEQARTRRA